MPASKRWSCHQFDPNDKCCPLTTKPPVKVSLSRTLNSHHAHSKEVTPAESQLKREYVQEMEMSCFSKLAPPTSWFPDDAVLYMFIRLACGKHSIPARERNVDAFLELCSYSPALYRPPLGHWDIVKRHIQACVPYICLHTYPEAQIYISPGLMPLKTSNLNLFYPIKAIITLP